MMEPKICQSCGMPMTPDLYGTNEDGSANETYCTYCYQQGKFAQECSMEEMADFCASFEVEAGRSSSKEEAKEGLMKYFATLDRWKAQDA